MRLGSKLAAPLVERLEARTLRAKLLVDRDHYDDLVAKALTAAKVSVWISTANLKTTMIEAPIGTRARARGRYVSLFETLADLARRGVEVRVLHAAEPSRPLQKELTRELDTLVTRRRCPRVHLKMIAIDGRLLYLGSANLTGAGLGAKGDGRRNFEMGIVTDSESMLDVAQERFDRIWRGAECGNCKLRTVCPAPLDRLTRLGVRRRPPTPPATSPATSRRTRRNPSSPR